VQGGVTAIRILCTCTRRVFNWLGGTGLVDVAALGLC